MSFDFSGSPSFCQINSLSTGLLSITLRVKFVQTLNFVITENVVTETSSWSYLHDLHCSFKFRVNDMVEIPGQFAYFIHEILKDINEVQTTKFNCNLTQNSALMRFEFLAAETVAKRHTSLTAVKSNALST
jgi:hypothetical protein